MSPAHIRRLHLDDFIRVARGTGTVSADSLRVHNKRSHCFGSSIPVTWHVWIELAGGWGLLRAHGIFSSPEVVYCCSFYSCDPHPISQPSTRNIEHGFPSFK
jgi:hypothetical protein